MTRLVLVRHAKAEAPRPGLDDHDRALTLDGRSSATALGTALADAGVELGRVLVSSAVRTQQTWRLMQSAFPHADAVTEPSLYETHVGGVIDLLRGLDSPNAIAIVGHEPTVSAAAAWLAGPGSDTKALQRIAHGLPTGTAALMDFEGPLTGLDQHSAVLTAVCATHAHF